MIRLIILLMISQSSIASFYNDRERGWYYFEKQTEEEEHLPQTYEEAQVALDALQHETHKARVLAVMNPSVPNIVKWRQLDMVAIDKGAKFASSFDYVSSQYPELSGAVENPVSTNGINLKYKRSQEKAKLQLKIMSESFGIILFRENGTEGEAIQNVINAFAEEYGFSFMRGDTNVAEQMQVKALPAIVLYNPKTNTAIPAAYGYVSHEQLIKNILLIAERL